MIGIRLQPVDTWFFRDGTPFAAGRAPQENVGSMFPPHPPTVTGALRVALAREQGWSGRGPWPPSICSVLGDGPENLGEISVDGPFLLRGGEPLFRAPRHLLGARDGVRWNPTLLMQPGGPVACDLGDVRLPEPAGAVDEPEKLKTGDGHWLTRQGLNAVLRGRAPRRREVIPSECLWSDELRIGLERDVGTRTAKEGMLYSTRHVRPHRNVALGVRINGLPQDWTPPLGQLLPLGGESRLAEWREWHADLNLDVPEAKIGASGRVALVALSPIDLGLGPCFGPKSLGHALGNAVVVSACIDRPLRIGGWDSRPGGGPLPMRSVLPPGSVIFCEGFDPESFQAAAAGDGTTCIGERQEWGFGLVALGVWPDAYEEEIR